MIKLTGPWNPPTFSKINFPCGEAHIRVEGLNEGPISISWFYENDAEVLELLFLVDAIKREGRAIDELFIPYFPFARQDRVAVKGEAFTLKVVANLINSIQAKKVVIIDPHSDVTTALLDNVRVITQDEVFEDIIKASGLEDFWLIAVDAGTQKKIHKLRVKLGTKTLGVVDCGKKRDVETGEIFGVKVYTGTLSGKTCVMVDDICDGGRSFIEVAKQLKASHDAGKIILMVTHGFFTKGFEVFDGLIDEIYTRTGKVYPK